MAGDNNVFNIASVSIIAAAVTAIIATVLSFFIGSVIYSYAYSYDIDQVLLEVE